MVGVCMNRFEALNTLGLEEEASEEEIKLAYYGIKKEINPVDYAENSNIQNQINIFLTKAKESYEFLLNSRNKTAARQVLGYKGKQQRSGKLTITAKEDKKVRLTALEKAWTIVATFLDQQRTRRNTCIGILVGCVVVGFFVLRYIRAMPPRIALFSLLALAVIAASTILTTSIKQILESRRIITKLDDRMEPLKEKPLTLPDGENESQETSEIKEEFTSTTEDVS